MLNYLEDINTLNGHNPDTKYGCCDNCTKAGECKKNNQALTQSYGLELALALEVVARFMGSTPLSLPVLAGMLAGGGSKAVRAAAKCDYHQEVKGLGKPYRISWWESFLLGPVVDAEYLEATSSPDTFILTTKALTFRQTHPLILPKLPLTKAMRTGLRVSFAASFECVANSGMLAVSRVCTCACICYDWFIFFRGEYGKCLLRKRLADLLFKFPFILFFFLFVSLHFCILPFCRSVFLHHRLSVVKR